MTGCFVFYDVGLYALFWGVEFVGLHSWASGCSIEGSFQVIAVCHNAVRVLGFAGFRLVGLCIAGHGVQVFHGLLPKGFRVQAASLQGSGRTPRSRPGALKKNTLGSR